MGRRTVCKNYVIIRSYQTVSSTLFLLLASLLGFHMVITTFSIAMQYDITNPQGQQTLEVCKLEVMISQERATWCCYVSLFWSGGRYGHSTHNRLESLTSATGRPCLS